jgi:hypothetical protein
MSASTSGAWFSRIRGNTPTPIYEYGESPSGQFLFTLPIFREECFLPYNFMGKNFAVSIILSFAPGGHWVISLWDLWLEYEEEWKKEKNQDRMPKFPAEFERQPVKIPGWEGKKVLVPQDREKIPTPETARGVPQFSEEKSGGGARTGSSGSLTGKAQVRW